MIMPGNDNEENQTPNYISQEVENIYNQNANDSITIQKTKRIAPNNYLIKLNGMDDMEDTEANFTNLGHSQTNTYGNDDTLGL